MNADDLQDLYNSLRGSRSALAVLDARALFMEKETQQAHEKLLEAYTTYQESRTRLLKQDPAKQFSREKDAAHQIRRLKRKQEKAREILSVFADLLDQLDRKAQREKETRKVEKVEDAPRPPVGKPVEPKQPAAEPVPVPQQTSASDFGGAESDPQDLGKAVGVELNVARPSSVSERLLDEFQENWGDDELDVIGRNYGFVPVESEEEIFPNALYFIRKGDESYLVFTPSVEDMDDVITLTNVVSRKAMSPIPRAAFVRLGRQRNIVLLLDKANPLVNEPEIDSPQESADTRDSEQKSSQPEREPESNEQAATEIEPERKILDMGAFSQLMDSAQRSGLVPGADQIGFVRDREFRKGNYDLALQTIEGIFSKFTANAAARSQKLQREDADIAAGRIKISPKDLQAKRVRDRAQDQAVERARSRFNRVLDGLRILIKTS